LKKHKETDTVCILSYKGPERLIENKVTGCITPMPLYHEVSDMYLQPTEECIQAKIDTNYQVTTCAPTATFHPEQHIQIKQVDDDLYIYCYLNNITVKGNEQPCEEKVIIVPAMTSFKIGRMRYSASVLSTNGEIVFLSEKSKEINSKLAIVSPVDNIKDEDLEKILNQMGENLKDRSDMLPEVKSRIWIYILIAVAIITSCMTTFLCYKQCTTRTPHKASPEEPTVSYKKKPPKKEAEQITETKLLKQLNIDLTDSE